MAGGSRVQEMHRLTAVDVSYLGTTVRRYDLQYAVSPATVRALVTTRVGQAAAVVGVKGAGGRAGSRRWPGACAARRTR